MQNTHWTDISVKTGFLDPGLVTIDTCKKGFIISLRLSYDYWYKCNVEYRYTDYNVGVRVPGNYRGGALYRRVNAGPTASQRVKK